MSPGRTEKGKKQILFRTGPLGLSRTTTWSEQVRFSIMAYVKPVDRNAKRTANAYSAKRQLRLYRVPFEWHFLDTPVEECWIQ